jgi:4-hydroxy-3-polyprenylbenzoate decarboxylase
MASSQGKDGKKTATPIQKSETGSHLPPRLIIGISGASGVVYGLRLLRMLQDSMIETHLVMSRAAQVTLAHETSHKLKEVRELADACYDIDDMAAAISSGSFLTLGMIVAPCSVKTLAEIASGVTTTLISRAADVVLKERRRLVLMVRETPLHAGHLKNMLAVTEMGGIIAPPVPAFYAQPQSLDEMVDHSLGRALDLFGINTDHVRRWGEAKTGRSGKGVRS